jgi:hypothetical protein
MAVPGLTQVLRSIAALAAMLLVAGPRAAALAETAYDEQQRRSLERIQEIESSEGPYAPALLDELTRLILLYRENEDHAFAVVTLERALQVLRANYGLHSLDQVPLLWQRIFSEEARGNDEAVWDLEQQLLTLARRYPGDLRAVPILRDVAARQMAVLELVVTTNEVPPQVIYGCFYKEWPNLDDGGCRAGSRKTVVQGMLAEANRNHADAIAILLRNEAYASDELRELEMELVRGAELIRSEYEQDDGRTVTGSRTRKVDAVPLAPPTPTAEILEPWRSRTAPIVALADWPLPYASEGTEEQDFLHGLEPRDARLRSPYLRGRQSLRRLHAYAAASSNAPAARAASIVQIADWDLLFSHNGLAAEGYALALQMLEASSEEPMAELFAPPLPVVLPSFKPNPLAHDESVASSGHVDVAFAITKYGRADDIEIRGAANADDAARAKLVTLLKSSRFRPRLGEDGLGDSTPVVVRYHLR